MATSGTIRNTFRTGYAFGKVAEKPNTVEFALDVDLQGKLLQENKIAPALLNNWQNYGAAYESASYWKDKCNVVHLSGMINGGTVSDGTVLFVLPSGYRPNSPEKFIVVSVNALCILDIYANGNVQFVQVQMHPGFHFPESASKQDNKEMHHFVIDSFADGAFYKKH